MALDADLEALLGDVVDITCRGSILLGKRLSVDGHEKGRLRVVSHAHADHMVGIGESIRESPKIIAHPATLEIMSVLGHHVPEEKAVRLNYGSSIHFGDAGLKVLRSRHIIGSIQVLYTSSSRHSIVYTGDFKDPGAGTEVPESDVVITEATYGSPEYVRPYKDAVEDLLADFVLGLLSRGPLVIKAYYGKQQEVMSILRERGLDAPFVAPAKVYRISRIAEKYGARIGDIFLEGTKEASEVIRQGWYIYFDHTASRTPAHHLARTGQRVSVLRLTGWLKDLYVSLDPNNYVFAFSGHSDFEELLSYIDMARPKLVLVDTYRAGSNAVKFSKYVEKNLKIKALPLPTC